jgi:hypothetical protein
VVLCFIENALKPQLFFGLFLFLYFWYEAAQGPYHIAALPSNVLVALGDEQRRDLAVVLVVLHDQDVERRVPVHALQHLFSSLV